MIATGTQTVGTEPVPIDGIIASAGIIYIRNNDTTKTLYVGGPDVTVENGFGLDKLATLEFMMPAGEQLYMVASSGTNSVSWMRVTH
jgi:hypothetical protein